MKTLFSIIIIFTFIFGFSQSKELDHSGFFLVNSQNVWDFVNYSEQSDFENSSVLSQIGDNNTLFTTAGKDNSDFTQIGDNNQLYFTDIYSNNETNMKVTTQGDNNWVEILGSNSLTDNMQINVIGNDRSIFVRSSQ